MLNAPLKVHFWKTSSGRCPVLEFVRQQQPNQVKTINGFFERCEMWNLDSLLKTKIIKPIDGIHELIVPCQRVTYRFFGSIRGSEIWFSHGCMKKSQRVPNDIRLAKKRLNLLPPL